MELVYQEKYYTDTMEEANALLSVTAPKVTQAIRANSFFAAQGDDAKETFLALAEQCNRLAAHEDGEIEIAFFSDESIGKICLTAPCFLLQLQQLALLQKIACLASEIVFDVTEEQTSQIIVSFDFSKSHDKLFQQFQRLFSHK